MIYPTYPFRDPVFTEGNAQIKCEIQNGGEWGEYSCSATSNPAMWALLIADQPDPYIAPPPLSPAEQIAEERDAMWPYALAFEDALTLVSSPVPGDSDMLETLEKEIEQRRAVNPRDKLVRWWAKVTIVLRTHWQMEEFREAFGLSPEKLDAVFRVAIAIDQGAAPDSTVVTNLVAAAEATP